MVKLKDLNQQIDVSYERQAHHHTTNYNYRQWANHQRSALKFLTFLQSIHSETKKRSRFLYYNHPKDWYRPPIQNAEKKDPLLFRLPYFVFIHSRFSQNTGPPPYPPNYFTWLMQTPKMLLLSTYILYLLLFGCAKNFVKTPNKNGENFTLYTNENKIPIDYWIQNHVLYYSRPVVSFLKLSFFN